MLILFLFCIVSMLSTIELTYLKKSYSSISKKHVQTFINLNNVFDFIGWFLNCVAFDEIKWLCTFTNKCTIQKFITKPQSKVSELQLTRFSPFDIKCRKPYSGNFFRASKRVSFSYFPKVALNHGRCPWYLLEFLWIMSQYLIQALCNV